MKKIVEGIERVMEYLAGIPLSISSIDWYQSSYRTISTFCAHNNIDQFGDSEKELFFKNQMLRREKGEIGLNRYHQLCKAATLLADQMQDRELRWKKETYYLKKLNVHFASVLDGFTEDLSKTLSAESCRSASSAARQFLLFLEDNGKNDFNALSADDVKQFMIITAPRYSNSMSNLTGYIGKFLSFVNDSGLATINANKYLLNPVSPHRKAPICFTDEEILAIFKTIDTTTSKGKRDYAIIKLAVGTGLRGVDISGLKLLDIDWRKKEICICQSKTKIYNLLPLLPDVGNAIMDYILNGRPKVKNPYIFLRLHAPHDRLASRFAGIGIIKGYMRKAGIAHVAYDGKTFHALRKTTGTRLVRSGEDLESIRQIMGSKHLDSLKPYVALDVDGLRRCCLCVSKYSTTKEGLM